MKNTELYLKHGAFLTWIRQHITSALETVYLFREGIIYSLWIRRIKCMFIRIVSWFYDIFSKH